MKSNKLDPFEEKNKVKSLLVGAGVKQKDIASRLKVSPSTVSLIVSGKKMSARVRRAVARALGVKVSDLWPAKKEAA